MNRRVERLSPDNVGDFFQIHSGECGWCYCTAWWTPTWDGWTNRSDKDNRQLREELFKKGEYDGYLLYENDRPVGWCQVGQRDRLKKLVNQLKLEPNPEVWAITCFVIRPEHRGKGNAAHLLKVVLEDLKSRGIKTVEAYPRLTDSKEPGEHWRGPEGLYQSAGFKGVKVVSGTSVMQLVLGGNS